MDNSNPVIDSSRKKVRDIITDVATRRRQDLSYLTTIVSGASRVYLPSLERREVGDEVLEAELSRLVQSLPAVDPSPIPAKKLEFLAAQGEWPVSGLMDRGHPIHPPGVHQAKGSVTTNRVFGGSQIDQEFARRMLEYRPLDEFQHSIKSVYTRGTAEGFLNRLSKLTSRKVPPITTSLGLNRKTVMKRLRRLLPIDLSVLEKRKVTWHNDLAEQLDEIHTSSISSAGPPYWTKKPYAIQKMLNVVMPLLHRAISEGKVSELFKQQPELFLGEVKNKLDRYEKTKVGQKTRPYFGLPFHLQALFSMMSQPFTDALEMFWQGQGSNAYGHSWAHGGVERLREWALQTKALEAGGRPQFCAYGDDTDIYIRRRDGLYRLAPDFQQMDGSVDAELIETVVDYVVDTLSAAWGDNPFFRSVAELWKVYATDPSFLVHGSEVYRKKQKDGLMTGVVGTTLFDTAKSVLAYDAWADEVASGRRELLKTKEASDYFQRKFGLVIKEGTWELRRVVEEPTPGELWAPSRFLGIYFIYNQGPVKAELVPYLNDEDWVDLLMVPRDDPVDFRRGRPKDSQVTISRRWYDRARGYLITGAFSNPLIRDWLGGFVNGLDPVSICMSVQAGNGKGEKPTENNFLPEDFEYPDSSGFPTEKWCENLYFTEENQWPGETWIQLLPDVKERLEDFRSRHKAMAPKMYVLEMSNKHPDLTPAFAAQQIVEYVAESSIIDYSQEVEPMEPLSGKVVTPRIEKPNKRSKIVDFEPGALKPKEKKRMPTAAEAIFKVFETNATPVPMPRLSLSPETKVSPLWRELSGAIEEGLLDTKVWRTPVLKLTELASMTGRKIENTAEIARTAGLFVLGREEKFVTKVPPIPSDPKIGGQLVKQIKENKEHAKVIGPTTSLIMKSLCHKTKAEPMELEIVENPSLRVLLHPRGWIPDRNPNTSLNSLFHVNGYVPKFKSRNVQYEKAQLVETEIRLSPIKMPSGSQLFLKRIGPNTRANIMAMYKYILQKYKLTKSELEQAREYKSEPVKDWADEVDEEERAKIFDETGLLFSVRGKYLRPVEQLGEWMEIRGNRVALDGVVWKQRGSETLLSFLKRTSKRLEVHGIKPHIQPLTSQPNPKTSKDE